MESWIFRIDQENNTVMDEEALYLAPELSEISANELKYIILVEDYVKSILKRKPKDERKRVAGQMVFNNIDYKPTKKVRKAMELYHSLVYETKRETVDILVTRINRINTELAKPDLAINTFNSLMKSFDMAQKKIDELNIEIDKDDQEEALKLKGGKKLSMIERWQRSQKNYERSREQI